MLFPLKNIRELTGKLENKKVIVRATLNVPIEDGKIIDDFRIQKFLPTLNFLIKEKARVIILSHLSKEGASLLPVFEYLKNSYELSFARNIQEINSNTNQITLLNNIRLFKGEKESSPEFTEELSSLGEIYLNEAFPDSHREHASIIGIPSKLPSFIGDLFENELNNLEKILNPERPFIAILAGKKASTKIPLIEKMLALADEIFIGGALVHNFLITKGKEIGESAHSDKNLINPDWLNNPTIHLPNKFVVLEQNGKISIKSDVQKNEKIVDTDLDFIETIQKSLNGAQTIFWNGSLGFCEAGFNQGTKKLAEIIAKARGFSVIGGGDSVSEIKKYGLENKFDFVSTGGGATLNFIANKTLPGIEAMLIKRRD